MLWICVQVQCQPELVSFPTCLRKMDNTPCPGNISVVLILYCMFLSDIKTLVYSELIRVSLS